MPSTRRLPKPPEATAAQQRNGSVELLPTGFRQQLTALLARMEQDGFDPIVWETLRTDERQEFLYGFGRLYDDHPEPRGIVTNAKTGVLSYHRYGLAADIVSRRFGWRPKPQFWVRLGHHALSLGLRWGGKFRSVDLPHVQFGGVAGGLVVPVTPNEIIAVSMREGGRELVWQRTFADRRLVLPSPQTGDVGVLRLPTIEE